MTRTHFLYSVQSRKKGGEKGINENIKTNILFVQFLVHVRVEVRRMGILCVEEYIIMLLKNMTRSHFLYSVERKKKGE